MYIAAATIHPKDQLLLSFHQNGCPLDNYVKKFLKNNHQVSRNDGTLKVCFWTELDNFLFVLVPAGDTTCILDQYTEYTLWLSEFSISAREVEVNNITDWQQFLQSNPVSPVISIPVLLPDPSPPLLSPGVDLKPAKRPAMNPVVCHLSGFTRVPSHYGLLGLQLHLNI